MFVSAFRSTLGTELISELIWIEIYNFDGFSLPTGNHYFSLNVDKNTTGLNFDSLEDN
jgi:hypothetical protein